MSDWNKSLYAWDFYEIQFQGFPEWDKLDNGEIYFVLMVIKKDMDKSSQDIGVEFDDIAHGNFHWRDWTDSGLPFADSRDIYWSGFSFQFAEDAKKFVELYGGKGNWMEGYEEFGTNCNNKRDRK